MKKFLVIGFVAVFSLMMTSSTGCFGTGGPDVGTQYTLDVSATITITEVNVGQSVMKLDTPTPQVMIGTTLVEVTTDDLEEIGINFINFDLKPQDDIGLDLQIVLTPVTELTPDPESTGVIFKLDEYSEPYDFSYLDLDLAAMSATSELEFIVTPQTTLLDDGAYVHLGSLFAEAEVNDRTKIPVLDEIPVIGFLFQGQQHEARVDNLLITLTPQIIEDTR
jgi:type II secretory pathway component HofQ